MTFSQSTAASKGITGSTLKIIAIVTMLIDHIGAALLEPMLMNAASAAGMTTWSYETLFAKCPSFMIPYSIMRLIGRIAFPIFCFLLVEGFLHTRNIKKYALRLGLFALISEIPFDLAFYHQAFYRDYQNVFFTLFIGLLVIAGLHTSNAYFADKKLPLILTNIIIILVGMLLAGLLKTDYGYMGVLVILLLYVLRNNRLLASCSACICLTCLSFLELTSFICVPLIKLYNGKRGLSLKYFFYAFYPVHLFLLYLIYRML